MMSNEALTQLREMAVEAASTTVEIDGVVYATSKLHDVRKPEPEPKALELNTLTGLVRYAGTNVGEMGDCLDPKELVVQVVGPDKVRLFSNLYGDFEQRDIYAVASCANRLTAAQFAFGNWQDCESATIALQALFEDKGDRAAVLRLIGTVTDEQVTVQADDGITQKVTARASIAGLENVKVPNPVLLAPFRTFAEVDQPLSPFVLRMRKQGGVQVALFEADGGAWRLEAIERIRAYLFERLPDGLTVLA